MDVKQSYFLAHSVGILWELQESWRLCPESSLWFVNILQGQGSPRHFPHQPGMVGGGGERMAEGWKPPFQVGTSPTNSSELPSSYSWPLSNTGLSCVCPLICVFFFNSKHHSTRSAVGWIRGFGIANMENTQKGGTAESRANCQLYMDLPLHRGQAPLTAALFKGQLYFHPCLQGKEPMTPGAWGARGREEEAEHTWNFNPSLFAISSPGL